MKYRAVLFDIDGTLLDTFDFIYGAFEHAMTLHGVPLPAEGRSGFADVMGGPLEECYARLAPGCDPHDLALAHRNFQASNLHLAKLFPGTLETLEFLKGKDCKIAAITTRSIRTSVRSLEQTGIDRYFDVVLSFEDVENVKPHPEPVLKALSMLGIGAHEAMMVGDTYADIVAGKEANVFTVAALYGFGGQRLRELKPDAAIDSIADLQKLL